MQNAKKNWKRKSSFFNGHLNLDIMWFIGRQSSCSYSSSHLLLANGECSSSLTLFFLSFCVQSMVNVSGSQQSRSRIWSSLGTNPFLSHPNVAVSRSAANKILLTCFSLIILFKYFVYRIWKIFMLFHQFLDVMLTCTGILRRSRVKGRVYKDECAPVYCEEIFYISTAKTFVRKSKESPDTSHPIMYLSAPSPPAWLVSDANCCLSCYIMTSSKISWSGNSVQPEICALLTRQNVIIIKGKSKIIWMSVGSRQRRSNLLLNRTPDASQSYYVNQLLAATERGWRMRGQTKRGERTNHPEAAPLIVLGEIPILTYPKNINFSF